MAPDTVNYALFIDKAMRNVIREALLQVEKHGMPGNHHFFITYSTTHKGVQMSARLREKYAESITIVMQHQFWDLEVDEDYFSVSLSFGNIPEKLLIPFAALQAFTDPSTEFGMQFHQAEDTQDDATNIPEIPPSAPLTEGEKVITLDAFRKK